MLAVVCYTLITFVFPAIAAALAGAAIAGCIMAFGVCI